MKLWKLALGAAAACAACCAAPLIGGMAALGVGSGLFAGGAGALSVATQSWLPLAAGAAVLAAVAGVVAWKRRQQAEPAPGCSCSTSGAVGTCGTIKR